MKKVNSVEEYIENHPQWSNALILLRNIMHETELVETLKWSSPVYTINGKNVVGIGAFKHHFGIWFFNGVFLKDEQKVLINAQEEKTKPMVLAYIKEAIENQKLGKELKPEKKKEAIIPIELKNKLKVNSGLAQKLNSLTPYKQREYFEYITTAKREVTKQNRLEKIIPMILQGIGLNDKYKNC
jgi:uncharacterized protein YdeI (YjbR/CyaY-like superfamily)